jgi:hypothetical protein
MASGIRCGGGSLRKDPLRDEERAALELVRWCMPDGISIDDWREALATNKPAMILDRLQWQRLVVVIEGRIYTRE